MALCLWERGEEELLIEELLVCGCWNPLQGLVMGPVWMGAAAVDAVLWWRVCWVRVGVALLYWWSHTLCCSKVCGLCGGQVVTGMHNIVSCAAPYEMLCASRMYLFGWSCGAISWCSCASLCHM